jgi:nucleotide-binding universal stress UspA family protein
MAVAPLASDQDNLAERPSWGGPVVAAEALRTVLVAVDGSPASLDALSWACGLAAVEGADVVLASVVEPAIPGLGLDTRGSVLRCEQRRDAVRSWWRDNARLGTHPAEIVVIPGRPGQALLEVAARYAADLVVAGIGGTRRHHDPLLGSVVHYVARHVGVALLAVPAGYRWRPLRHIVAALDGSDGARAVVERLVSLRAAAAAQISAVYACQPLTECTVDAGSERRRRAAAHDLARWAAPLGPPHLRLVVRDEAHPALAVLDVTRNEGADLVVAGLQATSRLTGTRPGATAFRLLESSPAATLLVPPSPPHAPSPSHGRAHRTPVHHPPVQHPPVHHPPVDPTEPAVAQRGER